MARTGLLKDLPTNKRHPSYWTKCRITRLRNSVRKDKLLQGKWTCRSCKNVFSVLIRWALSIYEKNPEISVVAKVEFPIGKKLFHLVVNPGTWPGARPWTWNWYKLQETSMEHDIPFGNSNRENGTTFLDFPFFLGIFQWDEPTKRVPFTAEPEIPEILTKWKAPDVSQRYTPSWQKTRERGLPDAQVSYSVCKQIN